ncbi:hypothetical protein BGX27_005043 [Mortierella sp. AM989]|nr:hypothetical protein BGX27_005043 [Mortierella sp. AM989]
MTTTNKPLRVLIVGGGIGGLMLGLMLEKGGLDYQILERSPEHRPLGSAITLNGTVLRLFEQLGLLEDLNKISKFSSRINIVKEDLETQGHIDLEHFRESVVFGRPDLFKVLVSHIPAGKLLMGKRVLSTSQTDFGVMIRCSDGSSYQGDILVGADGAYSSVRQCMHKSLSAKGMLPRSDSEKLKFDQHCVVGITDELCPERFPALKSKFSEMYGIIGKKRPYTLWLIPIVGNRFAWSIGGRILDSEGGQKDVRSFSFAEWWPEHASDICDLVRDYAIPNYNAKGEHYKNTTLPSLPDIQEDHSFGDLTSMSDASSFHSIAPSVVSLATSYCGSTCADNKSIKSSRLSIRSLKKFSLLLSPMSSGSSGSKKDEILSSTANTSTCSHSTENPQSFTPKRKTSPPAKPGTAAEIIDATSPDRISKVMLESRLFKVWHHERTVLLGDACHKVLPFAGQGAIQAILDGVSLANALYDMDSNSLNDITKAFKRYSNERIPVARVAVAGSRSFGKLVNVQGKLSDFFRKLSFRTVPSWILKFATDKLHLNRPQLTFLRMVPDRGSAKAPEQKYSPKYLEHLVRNSVAIERPQNVSVPGDIGRTSVSRIEGSSEKPPLPPHENRDEVRRERRHSRSHARFQPSMLDHMANKGGLTRSPVPPPLPLQAAPRHHPDVNVPLLSEESPHSRVRRHTHNGRSRSTSRSVTHDTYHHLVPPLPPKIVTLPIAFNSHSILPLRSFDGSNVNQHNAFSGFSSQPYTPPRSPLSTTPPVNFKDLSMTPISSPPSTPPTPIASQYRKSHKRTKSLQLDQALATSIVALEQTTALLKGRRMALREQRSLDHMSMGERQPKLQRH